jgi:hypothetical protein
VNFAAALEVMDEGEAGTPVTSLHNKTREKRDVKPARLLWVYEQSPSEPRDTSWRSNFDSVP